MSSNDDNNIDLYDDFVDEKSELAYWMEVAPLKSFTTTDTSLAEELAEEVEEQEAKRVSREIDLLIASKSTDGNEEINEDNGNGNDNSDNNKSVDVGKPDFLGPFDNIQAAVDRLLAFATQHHFGVRTLKSNNEKGTQIKKNVTYVCRYSGTPQIKKYVPKSDQKAHRNTESQRRNCPFKAYIARGRDKQVYITMKNCEHNHELSKDDLKMHSSERQLDESQRRLVASLHRSGATPTSISATLKEQHPDQIIDKRSIYNTIAKCRSEELAGRTPIQFLIDKLSQDASYTFTTRINNVNGQLESLCFFRKESLQLYDRYPTALVMDATYKTNRFGLPFLQVCGITNENKTFVVCQAFLRNEKDDTYRWILQQIKENCFVSHNPITIATDRDLSLLKAIEEVLPDVKHLLCRWHISKNVLIHAHKVFPGLKEEDLTKIQRNWSIVVSSSTEELLDENMLKLTCDLPRSNADNIAASDNEEERNYNPASFVTYLKKTWLDDYKEKFVSAWTDKFRHLGTTSTSRVEGAHAVLKRHLKTSAGDLNYVFTLIDSFLKQQQTEIMVRSAKQHFKANNQFNTALFTGILRSISRHALNLAFQQYALAKIDSLTTDPKSKLKPCTGSFSQIFGIPCAHFMRQQMLADNGCLTKQDFCEQWWFSAPESPESMTDAGKEDPFSAENIKSMREMFESMPAFDQLVVRRMIESIKTGELPYTLQDPQIIRSKGRPRGAGNRKQDRAKNTTQRDSSQFEYVEVKMEKEGSKKRKAKTDLETREKRARIDQEPLDSGDENEDAEADNKSEDECDFLQPEDKYGHLLPKTYYEISSDIDFASYDNIANIKRDGFCGFRAIAYEIFGDQDRFMDVKFAMRDRLAEVKEAYRTSFPLFDVDVLERIVNFGIEAEKNSKAISITKPYSCGSSFWFLAPECAQLAACTFNRPVAIYYTGTAITYLPVLPADKMKPVVAPLLLHIVKTFASNEFNHWITMKLKRSIKIKWPVIDAMRSDALLALTKPNDVTFWMKRLSFHKPNDKNEEEKEEVHLIN